MDVRSFSRLKFVGAKSPSIWPVVFLVLVIGSVIGLASGYLLEPALLITPWMFAGLVILSSFIAAFSIRIAVKGFKINWTVILVLVNLGILVLVLVLSRFFPEISFLDSLVLWSAIAYTLWILALTGVGSTGIGAKSILLALLQPALMWLIIISTLAVQIPDPLAPLTILFLSLILSTGVLVFSNKLFSAVFKGFSGLDEFSNFLKGIRGEQVTLKMGHEINPLLQVMAFKGKEKHIIAAPWLHSGPIRSIGGGNLSTRCIEELNKKFGASYFLHVPSSHEYNPSGNVVPKVMAAIEPKKYSPLRASDIVTIKKKGFIAKAQRLNDTYLVSLSNPDVDDYDINLFDALKRKYERKDVIFIDSHPNVPMKACRDVHALSNDARTIESLVDDAIKELGRARMSLAKFGAAIEKTEETSLFSFIIEVKGKKTLYFIEDTNGVEPGERRSIEAVAKKIGIDEVLYFSTDTHSFEISVLIERKQIPKKLIEKTILAAERAIGPIEFTYFKTNLSNVKILGETYYMLTTLIAVMARVIPLLLILLLVFFVILLWIF